MNHLEQLVSEWLDYNGYFVRRNVLVGKRSAGGYECELDVVAFNAQTSHLIQVEPSLDTDSWAKRNDRFQKKFDSGRKYIPELFSGIEIPDDLDQVGLFLFASKANHKHVGGGEVMLVSELYQEIIEGLRGKRVAKEAVSEQFPLLRTIQQCLEYEFQLFHADPPEESTAPFRLVKGESVERG